MTEDRRVSGVSRTCLDGFAPDNVSRELRPPRDRCDYCFTHEYCGGLGRCRAEERAMPVKLQQRFSTKLGVAQLIGLACAAVGLAGLVVAFLVFAVMLA